MAWRDALYNASCDHLIGNLTPCPLADRPAFSGASHASCSIWHIWSAVKRDGAPGRGKSSSRSSALKSSIFRGASSCHRRRHRRTILMLCWISPAISALFLPSAAVKIIRARCAFCWPVVCRPASFSNSCRTVSSSSICSGLGPGIASSSSEVAYSTLSLTIFTP